MKSYFALQEFEIASETMKLYIEKDPKADKTLADKYIMLLERSDEKVKVEILQLLVAGNETSTTAATWAFYIMSKHFDLVC